MLRFALPLGIFVVLAALLAVGLKLDPREVPSPLIGKPAPSFELPRLEEPGRTISSADMRGKVWLLNVWASWCVACRAEHSVISALANSGEVEIVGLNYKDTIPEARRWLTQFGDPYLTNAFDEAGQVGIDYGVYGVPETFVVDQEGIIRHKHIGPVTVEDINRDLLPLIRELKSKQS
jgi:cytochrome c biogenesis protein CcmG/thiol:disulfide interchange protein DsbE